MSPSPFPYSQRNKEMEAQYVEKDRKLRAHAESLRKHKLELQQSPKHKGDTIMTAIALDLAEIDAVLAAQRTRSMYTDYLNATFPDEVLDSDEKVAFDVTADFDKKPGRDGKPMKLTSAKIGFENNIEKSDKYKGKVTVRLHNSKLYLIKL